MGLGSPSAITDVDAEWAPASVVEGVHSAVEYPANIGYTNEKPAGSPGADDGRSVPARIAGKNPAAALAPATPPARDARVAP